MKLIARQQRGDTDALRDHEYDPPRFVDEFPAAISLQEGVHPSAKRHDS